MNRDIWHTVTVRIDVHGARLIAKVDNISAERIIQGLHKSSNYGISTDLTSVVLIGGMKNLLWNYLTQIISFNDIIWKYLIISFYTKIIINLLFFIF